MRSSAGNSGKGIVELVQDLQRIKKTRRLEDELLQDQEIRAELREIERKIFWCQRVLAFMTMGSLMLAVLINEICAGNDYADEEPSDQHQAFLEDPDRPERKCVSALASTAKLAQSALTLCLLLMIVSRFGWRGQQTSVLQRLRDRQVSVFKPREAYAQRWPGAIPLLYLAGELGVCAAERAACGRRVHRLLEYLGATGVHGDGCGCVEDSGIPFFAFYETTRLSKT
mgnify:CR=1 FL=1